MNDRKHLTTREVRRLITATRGSRTELRDRCLILLMFRHGLRVSEACALKLHQVDLESRVLHVVRLKKGLSTTHPLRGDELRAIKPGSPSGRVSARWATPSSSRSSGRRSTAGPPGWRSGATRPSCR